MPDVVLNDVLDAIRSDFAAARQLAERAMAQVDDEAFFRPLDDESNAVAVLAKHVGGNLRSRWRDVFTTDGEKPDRHRDGEFELAAADSRESVERSWEAGWSVVEATLAALVPADFTRSVTIRGERITLCRALTRSLAHTAGHTYQIVLLCKHWRGAEWQNLSMPRRKP